MPSSVLILEYDGPQFNGFQKQESAKRVTVQGKLETILSQILRENITLVAAGRTDAGVHAKGMAVSFTSQNPIQNYGKLILSVNAIAGLEGGLAVLTANEVPDGFHARFSCTEREYEYKILNTQTPHPLLKERALWFKNKIDFNLLQREMESLIGKHDFASFTKKSVLETYTSTERRITKIEIKEDEELKNLFKIVIRGTGFLHNMVRILVGTLLDIARGKIRSSVLEILESLDRTKAGKTAPPYGLYFVRAYYNDYPIVNHLYSQIYKNVEIV
ncbi:MAG TPA: tRNA pseudouridine(38-40) synthase TruA [Leptospiraceae bacterium]|nr:tRNA pseudouridine(38-40) synthase TruA [Leptospiraceae bacterium]HMW08187.1 tRNA pseudouridine(38-40) synthase TruA [Leptospiraceae bacterium]HMX35328.1 tRNA pseudouridine(38-40) synthase TruA [Leptospiraceae bacterium]HMY33990.1 tRNA pseudouridine(38-40) synthase TruA [Leptospiraceae bacterium]HMZ66516.1 tRNA pseudouridine(38-40) synthase TruA [Leptospiraceae bacterium]